MLHISHWINLNVETMSRDNNNLYIHVTSYHCGLLRTSTFVLQQKNRRIKFGGTI